MAVLNKDEPFLADHLRDHLLVNVQQRHDAQRAFISKVGGCRHQLYGVHIPANVNAHSG